MTVKPAHKILSLTHRNCWGKPNIWLLPRLLQKNKHGRSQLYWDQIFSDTIYLYNRKFDWCLIVDPIWLVWHTYISHWSTHWTAHNIPDAPTKRYFFTKKNNSKRDNLRLFHMNKKTTRGGNWRLARPWGQNKITYVKTGSLDNATQEFSMSWSSWIMGYNLNYVLQIWGGMVVSWLVHSSRAVQVWALAGDTVLCSWTRR